MTDLTRGPWRVEDELIEQPSWGGRWIIDLKGLSEDPAWAGRKVGQSYELAGSSVLIDPDSGAPHRMAELIAENPEAFLGKPAVEKFGPTLSLLIKLTQAKGNSFQVHLPEGKTLGHWKPKPEAWFYLAPGLYTFGLKNGTSFDAFSQVLRTMDDEMHRLSHEVKEGKRTVGDAREQAHHRIQALDPYAYVNIVEAGTDDVIDLTAGGIHHSWEEDNARFPDGNIVYEVQVDVPDDLCSMRGFDKGKILDGGGLRASHVDDYLATIERDEDHNNLARHISKPSLVSREAGGITEALFRTPYFHLDRITLDDGAANGQSLADGFHHLFVQRGSASVGKCELKQGRSYILPAAIGGYRLAAGYGGAVLLKTYLPVAA